jgi:hypothetical protein
MHSSLPPHTESRPSGSVRNERAGFSVVGQVGYQTVNQNRSILAVGGGEGGGDSAMVILVEKTRDILFEYLHYLVRSKMV